MGLQEFDGLLNGTGLSDYVDFGEEAAEHSFQVLAGDGFVFDDECLDVHENLRFGLIYKGDADGEVLLVADHFNVAFGKVLVTGLDIVEADTGRG